MPEITIKYLNSDELIDLLSKIVLALDIQSDLFQKLFKETIDKQIAEALDEHVEDYEHKERPLSESEKE